MIACRAVREALPELVLGRPLAEGEALRQHLHDCADCALARQEMEAVFSLLASAPDPPESPQGESMVRLALHSAGGPGPLQANRRQRRRETLHLALCGLFSGTMLVVLLALVSLVAGVEVPGLPSLRFVGAWLAQTFQSGSLWRGLATYLAAGALAVLFPLVVSRPRVQPSLPRLRGKV